MKSFKQFVFGTFLLGASISSQATVIGFESGLDPFFIYSGVSSTTVPVSSSSGYNNVAAFTGSSGVAFNPSATSPSTFSKAAAGTFDLTSFVIAGAWGSQTLKVEGLLGTAALFTAFLPVTDAAQVFVANWAGINAFRVTIDPNGYIDSGTPGTGQHWAMDNIVVNENSVPEPATLAILGLGLAGIGFTRRKKLAA